MNNKDQVEALRQQLEADGLPKPVRIARIAEACMGWPYVFGAWGGLCVPSKRGTYMRDEHPTIKSKCNVLKGSYDWRNIKNNNYCGSCKWAIGVRMYDCRGWTRWLLQQVGLDIAGGGCTSQYNNADNWTARGKIEDMPDVVCCVFKYDSSTKKYEHTGMHVGGGKIIHCSVNVQTGKTSDRGWTHYAIPKGLYGEEDLPVEITRPTLRKGSKGADVEDLQTALNKLGFDCGNVDGIFGTKTYNAVVAFQTEKLLNIDGIVGKKTWKALYDTGVMDDTHAPDEPVQPDEPEPIYCVTCHGLTHDQVMRILEICPAAITTEE